jgi:hypothetical protein
MLFATGFVREPFGHIQGDFFDSIIKHAKDLAQKMNEIPQMCQVQSSPLQVFAVGNRQVCQEEFGTILFSDDGPQLIGNVSGFAAQRAYAADQSMFTNHHA